MGHILDLVKDGLVQLVLPSLATVIAGYGIAFLKRMLERYGLKITTEQEERLRQLAKDAVLRAEELASKRIKAGGTGMTPNEKLTFAVNEIQARMPDLNLPDAAAAVEAALPKVGLGAASEPKPKPFPSAR